MLSRRILALPNYAELHCSSNCSFLSGASHSEELVARAQALGYSAYNMMEGFEGEANTQKQRTLINGWKHAGLPWSN